jgi:ABC-type dipeptide/oligopeptide/nickel transport system permease subunit
LESYVVSNVVTAALLAGAVAGLTALRRRPLWRGAGRELLRRRPAALALLVGYLVVAALDSIAWIDTRAAADDEPTPGVTRAFGDRALLAEPRSLIDRLFPFDFQEKSYSAPLADHELYGGAPLRYPGRHLLGTDILGRDVLQQTLKGARVALLIGGLTTLIVAPLALLVGVSAGYRGGWLDDVAFFVMATLASMPSLLLLIALIIPSRCASPSESPAGSGSRGSCGRRRSRFASSSTSRRHGCSARRRCASSCATCCRI